MAPDTPGCVEGVERTGGICLEIPADAEYLSLVRMIVASITFQRRDIDDERLEDIVLATSEACTRAVAAHAQDGGARPVMVDWCEHPKGCVVVVHDAALAVEADVFGGGTSAPEAAAVTDPGSAAVRGDLSLPLIKSLVDDLRIEARDGAANVAMEMFCPPAPVRPEEY